MSSRGDSYGCRRVSTAGSNREPGLEPTEIVTANAGRARGQFLEFPYQLYRHDPHWVPPLRIAQKEILNAGKHPFYAEAEISCFLARRRGLVVGRIAAILNRRYNEFHNERAGFFGFFECEDDPEAAAALLSAARSWLKARGVSVIRGPANPSTNYEVGLLVDGYASSPLIMMTYNPPYYMRLLEGCGLKKAKDLVAYYCTTDAVSDKVDRVADRARRQSGMTVRPINMKAFWDEVERIWCVYNSAWESNWGFVPMSRDEFFAMAKEMKTILVPDLCLIGEVDGRMAGFALALPDINHALRRAGGRLFPFGLLKILYYQRFIRDVRVLALGVLKEHRSAGVAAGFYAELIRNARRLGYRGGEISWVLEDNVLMNRSLEVLGATRYKTYRIYEWN